MWLKQMVTSAKKQTLKHILINKCEQYLIFPNLLQVKVLQVAHPVAMGQDQMVR